MRAALLTLAPVLALPANSQDTKYLEDFDSVVETVERHSAAVEVRRLNWSKIAKAHRPRFVECTSDVEHVKNVMRLLAELSDSHTGVTKSNVEGALPSKWDGLYGGGLWLGWEDGRVMLRGLMDGHPLEDSAEPGAAVATVDGWPSWLAFEREKRRITHFAGSSSDHSLFTSMSNRMLPFGDAQRLTVGFVHEGKLRELDVPRWGPGGKAFYPTEATLPDGVESELGAVAARIAAPWSKEPIGYLRITGSMNDDTVRAFQRAMDELEGVPALLLDCRWMGGGSDAAAWAMNGRFFPDGVDNGLHGKIEATGDWQFDGPVVMLQNEAEVSSAETFTWAMSETDRCVSVGRATGGWGIIPRGFSLPSGLAMYRLGVNSRPTPIDRVQTEGRGWPADVEVPNGPLLCATDDPVRALGLEVLGVLAAGESVAKTRQLFARLPAGDHSGFQKVSAKIEIDGWKPAETARLFEDDLRATLELELALLTEEDAGPPDALGAARRFEALEARAKEAGLTGPAKSLGAAIKKLRAEAAAQEALLELLDHSMGADPKDVAKFVKKHRRSRLADFVAEHWPAD